MDYTFDTNWLQPFESTWCTHEKIKYANELTGSQYLSLLSITLDKYQTHCLHDNYEIGIKDMKKVEKLLNVSLQNSYLESIRTVLGPLYVENDFDRYFYAYLKVCPTCIKQGYHSYYHQLIFQKDCPFHKQPLEEKLAGNTRIPFGVSGAKTKKAYSFVPELSDHPGVAKQLFNSWKNKNAVFLEETSINTVSDYYILNFFPFSLRKVDLSSVEFYDRSREFEYILQLKLNELKQWGTVINSTDNTMKLRDFTNTKNIPERLKQIYFNLFQSMAEQFRESSTEISFFLDYMQNINKIVYSEQQSWTEFVRQGILTCEVLAYFLWYEHLCNYSSPYEVVNKNNTVEACTNSVFFQYFEYEYKRYRRIYSDMTVEIFEKIMQFTLKRIFKTQYDHYYQLSKNRLNLEQRKLIFFDEISLAQMPIIIVGKEPSTMNYYILDVTNMFQLGK